MKRFVCLLLCLVMLIPAAGSLAASTIPITKVSISMDAPKPGDKATTPAVSLPSGSHCKYIADKSLWLEPYEPVAIPESTSLQAGKLYRVELYLEADSMYDFSDNMKVECTAPYWELDAEPEGGTCKVYIIFYVTEAGVKLLSSASLALALPEDEIPASEKPAVTMPSGAHCKYVPDKSGWIDEATMKKDEFPTDTMPSSAVLRAGKTYTAFIYLEASEGYRFDVFPEISCTSKAKSVESLSKYTYCLVYATFTMPKDAARLITGGSVSLNLPQNQTTAAQKPDVTVPSGAHYKYVPGKSGWYRSNDSSAMLPSSAVLKASKSYTALIYLRADDGYVFSPDIRIKVQCASEVKKVVTVPKKNCCLVYVTFVVPKVIISLKPFTIRRIKVLKKGKATVYWKRPGKKSLKKTRKVQIQISTDKTFKSKVITRYGNPKKLSQTIRHLKKGTMYYIRIRAYRKTGSLLYVSRWSAVKKFKTKKK